MTDSDRKNITNKLRKFCSLAEKCTDDAFKFLDKYELSQDEKIQIIEILKSEQFIDDLRYTRAYVNDKIRFNKWGKKKIIHSLIQKKIEKEIIFTCINDFEPDIYEEILHSVLISKSKLLRSKKGDELRIALIRFAISRGYEYDLIDKELKRVL